MTKDDNARDGMVYVVDDDRSVLKMLKALIETIGLEVCACSSAREFLDVYRARPCQCLVCDVRMPDIDGMALYSQLRAMGAPLPVIFLTGFAEVGIAVDAMRLGAFDFLEKPFSAQALLGKVQSALARSRELHAEWDARQAVAARLALLTARETAIARHVVAGKSSREVSELLAISVRTVENHRSRIMEKLHIDSTVELVKLFAERLEH